MTNIVQITKYDPAFNTRDPAKELTRLLKDAQFRSPNLCIGALASAAFAKFEGEICGFEIRYSFKTLDGRRNSMLMVVVRNDEGETRSFHHDHIYC